MLYEHTAAPGGEVIPLDEEALASIVGGEGPLSTILREMVKVAWECVKTGIDDVIAGAQEGYADAQAS